MTTPRTAKELAEYIPTDAFNLRNQLKDANGQINFDPSTDELSLEQLAVWLPRYLQGRGQLKGEKRQRVEDLLGKITANETPIKQQPIEPIKSEKPIQPKPIKQQRKEVTISTTEEPKPNTAWKRGVFLGFAIIAVLMQASHFAELELIDSKFFGIGGHIVSWGIAIVFESLALLLTVFSDKQNWKTWAWLIGFALVAVFMNLSFYGVVESPIFRKAVLSFALPFSIVATTHLFISNNQKK